MADDLTADNLMGLIVGEMAQAARKFVDDKSVEIKERLSVPVEYVTGPRGGTIIIRSKRGEPARKETGALVEGITPDMIEVANQFSASVYSETPYAGTLEEPLERLVMTDLMPTYEPEFLDLMVKTIEND